MDPDMLGLGMAVCGQVAHQSSETELILQEGESSQLCSTPTRSLVILLGRSDSADAGRVSQPFSGGVRTAGSRMRPT